MRTLHSVLKAEGDEDLAFRVEGGGRKLRWLVAVCLRPYRGQEYYQVLRTVGRLRDKISCFT